MARTDRLLQPVATAANLQASSTQDVAASNERIQISYDQSYGDCMSARGNVVSAAATPPVPDPARPAVANASDIVDASNTPALSDAASQEAKRFIGPKVRALLKGCPGEKIAISAHDAPLGPGVVARLVALNQPDGGDCLGHIGESDYLVLKTPGGGWRILLAAEPGSIVVRANSQDGSHRDLELRSFGSCIYAYRWDGGAYHAAGAQDCTLPAPVAPEGYAGAIR